MKLASVVPIFKQCSRLLCCNYLNTFDYLQSFWKMYFQSTHDLFYQWQPAFCVSIRQGFRLGNSTCDCLIDLTEEITTVSFDRGNYVVSSFLDLSKAVDTVNHHSLLNKLRCYGLTESEISWLRSYLKVEFHVYHSAAETIDGEWMP